MGILGIFIFAVAFAPTSAMATLDEATKKEIDMYLDKKMAKKSFLPSGAGEMFKLKGEMELEFVQTQNEEDFPTGPETDHTTDKKKPHLKLDKVVLQPYVYFGKHNFLKLEMVYGHDGDSGGDVNLEEYYFQSNYLLGENAPLDMNVWFRIGRDERWMKPKRVTESYPILGTIAWRDDELQLVLGIDTDYIYWRGSWGSGMDLGDRAIGEDGSFEVLQDDNNYTTTEQKRELSTGLGFRAGEEGLNGDLLVYYINDRMNRGEDLDVIDAFPNYHKLESGAPRPNQNRVGSRLTVNAFGARVMGEYLFLQDAMLKRHAWYTMFSYKLKLDGVDINGRNWLVGLTPVVRFDNLDVLVDKEETDSRTWDRWGTTFALIIDLLKHVKLKNEFTVNKEHTGGTNMVRNNEFLTQLEVKF
jgi:hypothetical protein